MNKSDSIANLAKALSIVQGALKPASKDASNPFFKSKYADLNSVWDACRDLLAANGLAVTQLNQITDLGVIVETVLMHESGEWISGEMLLPLSKNDPQGVGSATTYGRRYGLAAIIGIVSDEDDDGNHASGKYNGQKQAEQPKPVNYLERIRNAEKAIRDLGGKVEVFNPTGKTQDDMKDELTTLNEQYKRLQASKGIATK
jgi:hypothetical protein